MKIRILSCNSKIENSYVTDYSVGDIVRILRPGSRFQNRATLTYFGIDPLKFTDAPTAYPRINEKDVWRVEEIEAIYNFEFMVLLKNRINQYVVLAQNIKELPVATLVRKYKGKREELKTLMVFK